MRRDPHPPDARSCHAWCASVLVMTREPAERGARRFGGPPRVGGTLGCTPVAGVPPTLRPPPSEPIRMEALRLYRIDAFTRRRGEGNPAGVVTNAHGLDEARMQAIAHRLGHSETAFVLPPRGDDHDLHIR